MRALVRTANFRRLLLLQSLVCLMLAAQGCERVEPYVWGRLTVDYVRSEAMRSNIAVTLVFPESYPETEDEDRRYPVVFLLHGYSGDHTQWQKLVDLPAMASRYNMILACPDGQRNSWFFDSPLDPEMQFETFILDEVIPHIDSTYRTLGAEGRAITGLGMGGHAAMRLISTRPDSFTAAGSMSGILDLTPFPDSWRLPDRLGELHLFRNRWQAMSPINLVSRLAGRNKALLIDCAANDYALGVNRAYRDSAAYYGVELTYEEPPGRHNNTYWARRLPAHLSFFQNRFPSTN